MLTRRQQVVKRLFDLNLALLGLAGAGWLIVLAACAARLDTRLSGIFRQQRIGRHGRRFAILKIRTMRDSAATSTTVTTAGDPRITALGRVLRATKIDELPQLINVLRGDMSFVGPRPDVPEMVDSLSGDLAMMLSVRPGITGPASLKYRHEEKLLAVQPYPERFNREVLWPDKLRINAHYVADYNFWRDCRYLWQTLLGSTRSSNAATPQVEVKHAQHAA